MDGWVCACRQDVWICLPGERWQTWQGSDTGEAGSHCSCGCQCHPKVGRTGAGKNTWALRQDAEVQEFSSTVLRKASHNMCKARQRCRERQFQGMTKKMEEWRQAYICWEMRALRSKGRPDCINLKESKTLALKIMWVLKEFFKLKLRELRKWKFRKWKHKQACRYRCQHFV